MRTDAAEFRGLVERHQRMVFSLALRVTGEYGAAEEVAQDVFLELFRSAERLSSEDHVRFWLRKVTVHRATDALRRQAHRPETQGDEWMDDAPAPEGDSAAGIGTVLEARLEELLGSLPEQMRIAVVLRYQEEMLPDEIGKLLGQPLATVKSNLQRGLKLLRRKAEITMKEYVRPVRGVETPFGREAEMKEDVP
jgi:RNA polymerase sigma-70 factor (ECF subfamily)